MGIKFEFLKAKNGDSILVSTENTNILIDGGVSKTHEQIKKKLRDVNSLDLVVMTHVDNDHICGLITLLRKDEKNRKKIKELWFNSFKSIHIENTSSNGNIGASQGILFEQLLEKYPYIKHRGDIFLKDEKNQNEYFINEDIKLILLSPNQVDLDEFKKDWQNDEEKMKAKFCNGKGAENISSSKKTDSSINNRTSIAFILEYKENKYLFLGDAHYDVIKKSLLGLGYSKDNPLKLDFMKLSHHGSEKNIDRELLDLVDTSKYVILTDGRKYKHPSKSTLELLYKYKAHSKKIEIIFNYEEYYRELVSFEDEDIYNFKAKHRSII